MAGLTRFRNGIGLSENWFLSGSNSFVYLVPITSLPSYRPWTVYNLDEWRVRKRCKGTLLIVFNGWSWKVYGLLLVGAFSDGALDSNECRRNTKTQCRCHQKNLLPRRWDVPDWKNTINVVLLQGECLLRASSGFIVHPCISLCSVYSHHSIVIQHGRR